MKKIIITLWVAMTALLLFSCNHNSLRVSTMEALNVQDIAILCGGTIPDYDASAISRYGICWGETSKLDLENSHIIDNGFSTNQKGTFTVWIKDLIPNHTYYYRTFAVSDERISYGDVISVTTKELYKDGLIENAVQDYDGNTYNAVKLGDQVWMASNLKTKHYADGTEIFIANELTPDTAKYPNGETDNVAKYGYLYTPVLATRDNFNSDAQNESNIQGACPDGWHIPSAAEWDMLIEYLKIHNEKYIKPSGSIAKALASKEDWPVSAEEGMPGNNPESNNSTGFNAQPAGRFETEYYGKYKAGFENFKVEAYFISSVILNARFGDHISKDGVCITNISNRSTDVNCQPDFVLNVPNRFWGYSVRCIRD